MVGIGSMYPLDQTPDNDGFTVASWDELGKLTQVAMGRLALQYRMVLALRLYEDMSHAEIARILGCGELGARMRFFSAKRALSRELRRLGVRRSKFLAALCAFGVVTLAPSAKMAT